MWAAAQSDPHMTAVCRAPLPLLHGGFVFRTLADTTGSLLFFLAIFLIFSDSLFYAGVGGGVDMLSGFLAPRAIQGIGCLSSAASDTGWC